VVPFVPLAELAAHEQQLLTRLREHEAQKQAQVGQFLPVVAGHLRQERPLAVDHFIVRQRQHKVLGESIEHPEGQLAMVIFAVNGIEAEVSESIVHQPMSHLRPNLRPPR
jgi:hypothetical protein